MAIDKGQDLSLSPIWDFQRLLIYDMSLFWNSYRNNHGKVWKLKRKYRFTLHPWLVILAVVLYVSTFNNKWIYKYWRRGINVISISHTPWWWWLWWLCSRELKQCWGLFKHSDLICIRFRLNSHTHTLSQYGRLGNGSTFFHLPSTNGFESTTKVLYGTLR